MSLDTEIIVVSGLPRSGTSLMMQMLDRSGTLVLADQVRAADTDNPRGYYEFERVKQIKRDASWLPQARGRAVKMVSSLLYDLPDNEQYRVIFMQRELEEVLISQEKMLLRRRRAAVPREQMKASFTLHLERLFTWLPQQAHMQLLLVNYNNLMSDAEQQVQRISQFLDDRPPPELMLASIDQTLYRNRNASANR